MTQVLVTLPVHNEAGLLSRSVHQLVEALDGSGLEYRLSIAEDGSTDGTCEVLRSLQLEYPKLIVQCLPGRAGRGLALRRLWSTIDARSYVFVDADMAAGPKAVLDVLRCLDAGADVATGSRYCPGATVHRPRLRAWVSRAYNSLVRTAFSENLRDHQCGLKAFRREALSRLLPLSREDSWAWDTEVLVLAIRLGLDVREVPIVWSEPRTRRTPVRRLVSDVRLHGGALLRLRAELATPQLRVTSVRPAPEFHESRAGGGPAGHALLR